MPRSPSPQSRRLDGSHQDNHRTQPHYKFQVNPRPPRKGVVQQHRKKEDELEKPHNRIQQVLLHSGKSIRNLHFRWNRFKFDPATDDIEEFIRNVQECIAQLNYSDEATMNMIKSCMPKSVYAALYEKETLEVVIEMVINLFAREIEEEQPNTVAPATPFSMVQDNTSPLQDQISKLTDALCNIDVTRPFKPYITPRGRGRGRAHSKST